LKSCVVVIDEANATASSVLGGWLKIGVLFLEAEVVVADILQLFLVLLVRVVEELVHTFVLRLALYKFEEGSESLLVLLSSNVEIYGLESLVNVFFFGDGGTRLIWKSNHVPVKMANVESAVVCESIGITRFKSSGEEVHIHLVVTAGSQLINV